MSMWCHFKGNLMVLRAFVIGVRILLDLPKAIWTASASCDFQCSTGIRERYNAEMESVRSHILVSTPPLMPAHLTLNLLMVHRTVWIAVASLQDIRLFILAGSLQFLIAPYSFSAALMIGSILFLTMCLGHCATALALSRVPLPDWSFAVSYKFIMVFLLSDFIVSCYFAFISTMVAKPKLFPFRKTVEHMLYGSFNTKTYFLLVFLFCRGASINVAWLVCDAVLGLGAVVNNIVQQSPLSWEFLFYHVHRLQHLPVVYDQGHKAHHRLHDTTAFDAHLFSGSGFPEEWFLVFVDIMFLQVLGVPPPALTYRMLKYQLGNKETHQRKDKNHVGEQYHEDHHIIHRANFGFARPMLDMYLKTYKSDSKSVMFGTASFEMEETDVGMVKFKVRTPGFYDAGVSQTLPYWAVVFANSTGLTSAPVSAQ
ncbi:unnamed protein product [Polarella glacialis]|nr:unnamed protein product [Polarella glacialis]